MEPVKFAWKDKEYELERPRVRQVQTFLAAQQQFVDALTKNDEARYMKHVMIALGSLNCPEEAIDNCYDNELGELYVTLRLAFWPAEDDTEGDEGNPPGGALTP